MGFKRLEADDFVVSAQAQTATCWTNNAPTQAAAATGGGLGQAATQELGGGAVAQTLAGLGGGLAGAANRDVHLVHVSCARLLRHLRFDFFTVHSMMNSKLIDLLPLVMKNMYFLYFRMEFLL